MSFISGGFFPDIPRGKILKRQQSQVVSSMNSIIHLSLSLSYILTFEIVPAKVLLILYVALISSQVHALWLESAESGVCIFFLLLSLFLYGFTKIESCYNSTILTDTVQFGTESFFIVLSKFTSSYKWVSFIMADINTE